MMGRCASVVNGILTPFVTIADSGVTSMRLARLVRAVGLAMQGTEGGTGVQQKLAVWEAVRKIVRLWPETPAVMEPDLRLLAVNAPEPIVFAEDGRSVSVAGGSIIVRLASDAKAQRAMELPGAIWGQEDGSEEDGNLGFIAGARNGEEQEVLGAILPMETESATRVFVVCPNSANKGIRYLWTRRWTPRGVIHESECRLNVTARSCPICSRACTLARTVNRIF